MKAQIKKSSRVKLPKMAPIIIKNHKNRQKMFHRIKVNWSWSTVSPSHMDFFGRAPGSSGLQTLLSVTIVINIYLTLILNVNIKCIPGFELPSP